MGDTSLGTDREFDADGNLVSVNGDDQVKKPAAEGKPKASDRIFNADGELVAGVGDPIPDDAAHETPAEAYAEGAGEAETGGTDPLVLGSPVPDSGDAAPVR